MFPVGIGIGIGLHRNRYSGNFVSSYNSRVLANGGTIEGLTCVMAASTLLQQASLLLIPSGYKAGTVYSVLPKNGNGDLTFSRGSTAYRTIADSTINNVAVDVPRLSYMYGSCPALLLEPQRTNITQYSEQFENAYWSTQFTTVTANQITAPNGTLTADKIIATNATGVHALYVVPTVSLSTYYTGSFFVKAGEYSKVYFRSGSAVACAVAFDLATGTVISTFGTPYSYSITPYANGWYRVTLTYQVPATDANWAPNITGYPTGATLTAAGASFTGDNTSGIYVWGFQLEQGVYATTYIPTTNASATRLADSFTRNNIYTNGLITAAGGSWFVELRNNIGYTRDSFEHFGVMDNLIKNGIIVASPATANSRKTITKVIGGVYTNLYTTTTDTVKILAKWNGSSADIFVNGVKQINATTFTSTILEYFIFNNGFGTPAFIQQSALFPTPLTDTQCEYLTGTFYDTYSAMATANNYNLV